MQTYDVTIGGHTYRVLARSKNRAHGSAVAQHRQALGLRTSDTVLADSITIARPVLAW